MKEHVKITEALHRLSRRADVSELETAIDDFLAAYGETRSAVEYGDATARANIRLASTLLDAIDKGLIEIPQADDGTVIIPDMLVELPDGARLYVDSIEIESTATGRAPMIHFEDESTLRARRGSGISIVRTPVEDGADDR